jgi:hypothetical protein
MDPARSNSVARVTYGYKPELGKMAEISNTTRGLTPHYASLADCTSGWINAVNLAAPSIHAQQFNIDRKEAEKCGWQGKWIIPFEKGDPRIDGIWDRVCKGVEEGVFCEAKVSIAKDERPQQKIIVYTLDSRSKEDVLFRLKELQKRHIVNPSDIIFYMTEEATRKNLDEYLYSSDSLQPSCTIF